MRVLVFFIGILLLLVPEILRVYYIMPFPGSQENVATDLRQVDIAYWLHTNIWWLRLIGLLLIASPLLYFLRKGNWWKRLAVILPAALCALVIYAFNFKFMADKMFYPPREKLMRPVPQPLDASTESELIIAIEHNGDARAYPIELIGYHHQVLDTIGGGPVLVTYCTVCRTGRAWKPEVNGLPETFRLVGMDHFNAMFEDSRTGSWWRQVTGECIAGPLKGQTLDEVPSQQMTLGEFGLLHPSGLVFQPDSSFMEEYAGLKGFDDGTIDSGLEYRDTASWQAKSWVVGLVHNGQARAYDWNVLSRERAIHDTLAADSITIRLGDDGRSFAATRTSRDTAATSQLGPSGELAGRYVTNTRTDTIPAYQEFWHSWRTFHPNTTRYGAK